MSLPALIPERPAPKHRYGWKRPLPGLTYPTADTTSLKVAEEVDPRKRLPRVFDQLSLGSCTANATCSCFEYDSIQAGKDCGVLSRRWVYHFEKCLEGTAGQGDTGAMGHDAFRVAKHGIPLEAIWPYTTSMQEVERQPPNLPRAYTLTSEVRAPSQTINSLKQVLSNGQTVPFGFTVFASFESIWPQQGFMPMPKPNYEDILGGHEVLLVGYLKAHSAYALCMNSWGVDWGLEGYFFMPWKFLLSRNCSDFRTIVRHVGEAEVVAPAPPVIETSS